MHALFMAMILTGAGGMAEAKGSGKPPPVSEPPLLAPPVPMPVPAPSAPPLPVAQQPVLLRGATYCFPEMGTAPFIFDACFHPGDYPMEAYNAREQGVVGVRLTIASSRGDTRCEITESSGSAELDNQTCTMLVRRALATEGRSTAVGQVAWVLPPSPPVDTRSPLATYFSADDYPAAALRKNAQGTVIFALDVAVNGRVTNCLVTGSSGEESLDTATCRILRSRARFEPAQDALGRAVPGTWSGRLNWRLPSE